VSRPSTASARAMVITGPRRTRPVELSLGALAPESLRIRIEGCGVCGSNVPVWDGRPWFQYPLPPGAPGHEGWGRVEAVGGAVTDGPAVGDRVAFLSDIAFGSMVDVAPEVVVVLPPALEGQPFPGEAIGCGFNVAARSGFASGQTVVVVGIGFLGAIVTAIAAQAGARVIAVSRRTSSLELATAMGAAETIPAADAASVVGTVEDLTRGALADVVVEAVGTQSPLDLAAQLTRERGRLVVAGFHQDGPRTVDLQLWNWRGIDVVNAHERDRAVARRGIKSAIDAVASGWLNPAPLYTDLHPLDRLDMAMDAASTRSEGFMKALVLT
jgi:threonine dehydrogenase-like Zn-dependent dehydrogenase